MAAKHGRLVMTSADLIPSDAPTQQLLAKTLAAMFKHWQYESAGGDHAHDHTPSEADTTSFHGGEPRSRQNKQAGKLD